MRKTIDAGRKDVDSRVCLRACLRIYILKLHSVFTGNCRISGSYVHRNQFSDKLQTTDEDRNEEKSQIKRKAEDIYADIHVSRPFAFIGGHWNLFSGYEGGVPSHLLPCILFCNDPVSYAV